MKVAAPQRLVVFDALMVRALTLNDTAIFPDELAASRIAFRGQRFRVLLTDGIITEYQKASFYSPQIVLQPTLEAIADSGRSLYLEESALHRRPVNLERFPKRHRLLVREAIVGDAEYFVTGWPPWLRVAELARSRYGLHIVTAARFFELEG